MNNSPVRRSNRHRTPRFRDDEETVTPITVRTRRRQNGLIDATENREDVDEIQQYSPSPEPSPIDQGTPSSLATSGIWPRTTPDPPDVISLTPVRYSQSQFQNTLQHLVARDGPCSLTSLVQLPQALPESQESHLFHVNPPSSPIQPAPLIPTIIQLPTSRLPTPPLPFPQSPPWRSQSPSNSGMDDKPSAAFALFGLRNDNQNFRQSFFESDLRLENEPLLSDILQSVLNRPLSQVRIALSTWLTDERTLVATSVLPIDVSQDRYNHYTTRFTYHGSLNDILDGRDGLIWALPTPDSEDRTILCNRLGLGQAHRVYAVYIVQEVCLDTLHMMPNEA
jgi:hypothetical protein